MAGSWRGIYTVSAVAALYFNFFVLVVQLFRRIPALVVAAPTESEPPFAIAQGLLLLMFVTLGVVAVKRFHPELRPRGARPTGPMEAPPVSQH